MKFLFLACSFPIIAATVAAIREEEPNQKADASKLRLNTRSSSVEEASYTRKLATSEQTWNNGWNNGWKTWNSQKEKNKEMVIDYLDALFIDYDVETAATLITPDHIQHNWLVETGSAPILASVPFFEQIGMTYVNHRIIAEGDMVVTHNTFMDPSNAFGLGESFVTFDLYRVEGNKLAEHWDIIISETPPNPSGNTLTDGPTNVESSWFTRRNKNLVSRFVNKVLINDQFAFAAKFISPHKFVQHSSTFGNGVEAFVGALEDGRYAGEEKFVRIAVAEGNFVFVAMELATPGQANTAVFDLFRIERGYIVEQWSLLRFIPDASEFQHENGFF